MQMNEQRKCFIFSGIEGLKQNVKWEVEEDKMNCKWT